MPDRPKAIAFDVDPERLLSLRQAFPDWGIDVMDGATDPPAIIFLVPGTRDQVMET
jgi:hypothetical protein